ncbi:MAG TPA: FTR1 family protein [Chloroflexota bacterium]|jgi:high-affinity iron transporter|nr:FTR1 family protein [Chloroflexota bacterium]
MIGSFLIFLREGIEGSMIVAIMLTYLSSAGRRDLFRWIFAGVAAALLASSAVAIVLYLLVKDSFVGSTAQTWFETGTFLVAVGILTYMTFWMKRHSRTLSAALREDLGSAIVGNSALALAGVAFVTVGREAIETAIFTLAIAFRSSWATLLVGAVSGLGVAMVASFAMYRAGLKLNLKRFFTVIGVALLVVAAGLLADATENLQRLGVLPGAGQVVWHTGRWLSEDTGLGDILHGILGYASAPTALQLGVWALFLMTGLSVFFELGSRIPGRRSGTTIGA